MKFLSNHKRLAAMLFTVAILGCMAVPCFAVDETPTVDVAAMMTTSVNTIVSNSIQMISAVLPVLVTVFGATLCIRFGIKFIKQVFGKA